MPEQTKGQELDCNDIQEEESKMNLAQTQIVNKRISARVGVRFQP